MSFGTARTARTAAAVLAAAVIGPCGAAETRSALSLQLTLLPLRSGMCRTTVGGTSPNAMVLIVACATGQVIDVLPSDAWHYHVGPAQWALRMLLGGAEERASSPGAHVLQSVVARPQVTESLNLADEHTLELLLQF